MPIGGEAGVNRGKPELEAVVSPSGAHEAPPPHHPFWLGCLASKQSQRVKVPHSKCAGQSPAKQFMEPKLPI